MGFMCLCHQVDWQLVLAAVAFSMVFQMLWYGPVCGGMFVTLAYRNKGIPRDASMFPGLVAALVGNTVVSALLFWLVVQLKVTDVVIGAWLGVFVAGFSAAFNVSHYFFESKPFGLFLMHETAHFIVAAAVGAFFVYQRTAAAVDVAPAAAA